MGITGRALHDILFGGFKRQGQRQGNRRDHVDPENLQRRDRQGQVKRDAHHDGASLPKARRQDVHDGLFEVVVNRAAFLHRMNDSGEIVVGQNHHSGFLGSLGPFHAHCHPDIGTFEGRGIVHPVAGHGNNAAFGLQRFNQA